MSTVGLNFKRHFLNDNTRFDLNQALELRQQRIFEREGRNNKDLLISNLCDVKVNYDKIKSPIKSAGTNDVCGCWYTFNEFIPKEIEANIECQMNREVNLFNKTIMNGFHKFLYERKTDLTFSDPVTWAAFESNDIVTRTIYEMSEEQCSDLLDEDLLRRVSNDKWSIAKRCFNNLTTGYNLSLISILANLCSRSVTSFSINISDIAVIDSVLNTAEATNASSNNKCRQLLPKPVIFIIRATTFLDYLLIPLLFKQANLNPPICFVSECQQVMNIKFILSRMGYIIIRNAVNEELDLQTFVVSKKTSLLLESKRPICIVLNESLNSNLAATEEQNVVKVLVSAVRSHIDGKLEDPILIPLLLSHEFVPKEFTSRSKSLWTYNSLTSLSMMSSSFGIVKVSVIKPTHYTQFSSATQIEEHTSPTSTDVKVERLMKHLCLFTDRNLLIMPTNLIAFVLLFHFKDQSVVSLSQLASVSHDFIKYVLPLESLCFETSSVITIVRRGCNLLSHLLKPKPDQSNPTDFLLTINYDNYSDVLELGYYADVVIHRILMKSVVTMAFAAVSCITPSKEFVDQICIDADTMNRSVQFIVKKLLSKFFQFLLPCDSLENETIKANNWWNETMVSVTKQSDVMWTGNENNSAILKSSENTRWFADAYIPKIKNMILLLARSFIPRIESMSFVVSELFSISQSELESLTPLIELFQRFNKAIKQAAKSSRLRYKNALNVDYFMSSLANLAAHDAIKILDLTTMTMVTKYDDPSLVSSQYAVLVSDFYSLQRWKADIDLALITA